MWSNKKLFTAVGAAVLILGAGLLFVGSGETEPIDSTAVPSAQVDELDAGEATKLPPAKQTSFANTREFAPQDFKLAYDGLSHANITKIIIPPGITGNDQADAIIRDIAEGRGYQLRHVATSALNTVDGVELQYNMIEDWEAMRDEAAVDGISMSIVSGYRSIDEQATLFLERMTSLGASAADVAAGSANGIVDETLEIAAPPGYSRHHSGYTIDLQDAYSPIFGNSASYAWLSENNFENAKKHGFIPSYPEGIENQGPRPEEWELVWVGKPITFEQ